MKGEFNMTRDITFPKRGLAAFLATIIAIFYAFGTGVTVFAADELIEARLEITGYEISGGSDNGNYDLYKDDTDIKANQYGQYLWVTGKLTDASGAPIADKTVKVYYDNRNANGYTDENGIFHARLGGTSYFKGGEAYDRVYALFPYDSADKKLYSSVQTDSVKLTIVKPDPPVLEVQNAKAGKSDGSITVAGAWANAAYEYQTDGASPYSDTELTTFYGTASDLVPDVYYIRSKARLESGADGYTLFLASDYAKAEVDEKTYEHYTVTLQQDENASWKGVGDSSFELSEDADRSIYISPKDGYTVESVQVSPRGGAAVEYNGATGEVFISGITQNVTLIPVVSAKKSPANIDVEYEFIADGNYSEYNSAVQVVFTLTVTDQSGDPAADAAVYFKQDSSEVSFVLSRRTDNNGQAVIRHSYALNYDDLRQTEGSWLSQFALDSDFETGVIGQEIKLVQQSSADLELYTDQIISPSSPDAQDGKVIKVPENYELYTGTVHQGAITVPADGEWIKPAYNETSGYYEFTGLSSGRQYVIRAGELADYDGNTFYLASNFSDFMVPYSKWSITVDTASSQHVVFPQGTSTTAESGGTVYIYAQPEEGYEITEWTADKPNYVSGISYSEEYGYITVEGITGSITLTVKAEKIPETDEPVNTDDANNRESAGNTVSIKSSESKNSTESTKSEENEKATETTGSREPPITASIKSTEITESAASDEAEPLEEDDPLFALGDDGTPFGELDFRNEQRDGDTNPNTGDPSDMTLTMLIFLLGISLCGSAVGCLDLKKHRTDNND